MWPYNEHESDWFSQASGATPLGAPQLPSPEEIQIHIANGKRLQALAMRGIIARAARRLHALLAPRGRRTAKRPAMARQTV